MLTITKIFVVLCVAESVNANAMPQFTSVKGSTSAKGSTICSPGYEPITSTWKACKAAAKWPGQGKGQIIFVGGKSSGTTAYPPGCYWQYNNGKNYRMFCHLKKKVNTCGTKKTGQQIGGTGRASSVSVLASGDWRGCQSICETTIDCVGWVLVNVHCTQKLKGNKKPEFSSAAISTTNSAICTPLSLLDSALPRAGTWLKIGSAVGWGAKNDRHGTLKVSQKFCASMVKFVHKSGYVSCRSEDAGRSNFGCKGYSEIAIHLSTSNQACKSKCSIAPSPDDNSVRWADRGRGWWYKDGYSSDSKDITLNLPGRNYCFEPSQSYHLWYGEDDHDSYQGDNHGTAKTDVFVKLSCPAGFYSPQGEDGCKACTKIANCAGEITCSSNSDKKCAKCKEGYFLTRNKDACMNGRWVKILQYADMYKPTAKAVGDLSKPSTVSGFAKLSDAAINAIPADENGYFYFKLEDTGDKHQPTMLVRTKAMFEDTAVGFGWSGQYDLCNKWNIAKCDWKNAKVKGIYIETEEVYRNTCKRWFADYSRPWNPHEYSGMVNCYGISGTHRCFSKGYSCSHAARDHVTIYKWSPSTHPNTLNKLQIVRAWYGGPQNCHGTIRNIHAGAPWLWQTGGRTGKIVTGIVKRSVQADGSLNFNPEGRGCNAMFGDPRPGCYKILAIDYRYGAGTVQTWMSESIRNEPYKCFIPASNATATHTTATYSTVTATAAVPCPKTCRAIKQSDPTATSGVYAICPDGKHSSKISVYCDQTTLGGGWMLMLTQDHATDQYDKSVNPLTQNLNVDKPSPTSRYSRDWSKTGIASPLGGSEFLLKRGTSGEFVRFVQGEDKRFCGFGHQTTDCNNNNKQFGHTYFTEGEAYDQDNKLLRGIKYFNGCTYSWGCGDSGVDGIGFGTKREWLHTTDGDRGYGGGAWPGALRWNSETSDSGTNVPYTYWYRETVLCPNIVRNGDFENGWTSHRVYANIGNLQGWVVTQGSVDFGHCTTQTCAHSGEAYLNMCGGSRGAIVQTVKTVPNAEYVLKLAYDTHATCTSEANVMEMDVVIDGKTVKRLRHESDHSWDPKWERFVYEFKASGDSARLEFVSLSNACGCMVLDDVMLRPKQCDTSALVDSIIQYDDRTSNGESITPYILYIVIIALLASLLLVVAAVGIMYFVKMRKKKKSERNSTIVGDGNVYNLEPTAHSCIPVADESKEEFEKHLHVDSQDATAASPNSKLMCESGIGNEELHTCEVVKDDGYTV